MSVKLPIDPRKIADGSILVWHLRYESQLEADDRRGRADPLTYTYAMLKAGGLWYVTGAGRVPQAAGWGAVEKWLERDGRIVVRVELVTAQTPIWPEPEQPTDEEIVQALIGPVDTSPV